MNRVEGHYYDGRSSVSYMVVLEVGDDGAVFLRDESGITLQRSNEFKQLKLSSRLGNSARYIYFGHGEKFETSDNDAIDSLIAQHGGDSSLAWVHRLESARHYVLLALLVIVTCSWLTITVGLPAVGALISERLPSTVAQSLGKETLLVLDEHLFQPSELNLARQHQLQSQFQDLFAEQLKAQPLQLLFRGSEWLGANAIALPSGELIFTDDIVMLAETDEELLTVMAHEVGHIVKRHGMRRVVQDSLLVFILAMITGDVSAISSLAVGVPTLLLELGYSRDFEREADDYALQLMQRQGLPSYHFANMLQRLEQDARRRQGEGGGSLVDQWLSDEARYYLSTHPSTQERIRTFTPTDSSSLVLE